MEWRAKRTNVGWGNIRGGAPQEEGAVQGGLFHRLKNPEKKKPPEENQSYPGENNHGFSTLPHAQRGKLDRGKEKNRKGC